MYVSLFTLYSFASVKSIKILTGIVYFKIVKTDFLKNIQQQLPKKNRKYSHE
jgi:hypothetical protein